MFVNELSLSSPAFDINNARGRAIQFVYTMREAASLGIRRTIHTPRGFRSFSLGPDYYWHNWLKDRSVDQDLKRYFLALATKEPYLDGEPSLMTDYEEIDCYWDTQLAFGLKGAYIADGLAISIISDGVWDTPYISCQIHALVNSEIEENEEVIPHASSPVHINSHEDWVSERIRGSITSGTELWASAPELFPGLIWCGVVESQAARLPRESVDRLLTGLFALNNYCRRWNVGPFNPSLIGCRVSPESKPTLAQYGSVRTFRCPDGTDRVFSWHIKVGRWRIYFEPFPQYHNVVIGYLGAHLPTVDYH